MREVPVDLPASQPQHDVLATLWARTRIGDLMSQDWSGLQSGQMRDGLKDEITQLGLDYRLMTQFTSFVAVEEKTITEGGQPKRVEVPIEMPEGVSYEGVFGPRQDAVAYKSMATPGGVIGGVVGGVPGGMMTAMPRQIGVRAEATVETPRRSYRYKIDARLTLAIQLVISGKPLDANSKKFVRNGKVYIEVWLDDVTSEVRDKLKSLGFELTEQPKVAKVLTGRIAADKLETLAKLDGVHYITPHVI